MQLPKWNAIAISIRLLSLKRTSALVVSSALPSPPSRPRIVRSQFSICAPSRSPLPVLLALLCPWPIRRFSRCRRVFQLFTRMARDRRKRARGGQSRRVSIDLERVSFGYRIARSARLSPVVSFPGDCPWHPRVVAGSFLPSFLLSARARRLFPLAHSSSGPFPGDD